MFRRLLFLQARGAGLPVSATVAATTSGTSATVETASSARTASAKASTTSNAATAESAADRSACDCSATVFEGWSTAREALSATYESRSTSDKARSAADEARTATDEAACAPISTTVKAAPVPRTGADEDSAIKPLWTVVAVRGTGIGVIIVVTVATDRRWADISGVNVPRVRVCWSAGNSDADWTNSNTDGNSLRVCERCRDHENAKHCEKF